MGVDGTERDQMMWVMFLVVNYAPFDFDVFIGRPFDTVQACEAVVRTMPDQSKESYIICLPVFQE